MAEKRNEEFRIFDERQFESNIPALRKNIHKFLDYIMDGDKIKENIEWNTTKTRNGTQTRLMMNVAMECVANLDAIENYGKRSKNDNKRNGETKN